MRYFWSNTTENSKLALKETKVTFAETSPELHKISQFNVLPVILPGDQVVPEHHDHTVLTVLALVHWPVGSPEIISKLQSTMQPSPISFPAYTGFNQSIPSIYIKLPRSVSPMYQKPTPVKLPSKSASSARKSICLKIF